MGDRITELQVGAHPWVGQQIRGISEQFLPVFEREGKIVDVQADAAGACRVRWIPTGGVLPWTSDLQDIEFLPARIAKKPKKAGRMSRAELQDIRARLPELKAALKPDEALQDLHLALGEWLIHRDVARDIAEQEDIQKHQRKY